jgi:hypothetical protein
MFNIAVQTQFNGQIAAQNKNYKLPAIGGGSGTMSLMSETKKKTQEIVNKH